MPGIQAEVELKHLQSQRDRLEGELKQVKDQQKEICQKINNFQSKLKLVYAQIEELSQFGKQPIISEHAILRYLERVKGVDIDAIRQEMLPDDVAEKIIILRTGLFPVANRCKLRVKNNVITTVIVKEKS